MVCLQLAGWKRLPPVYSRPCSYRHPPRPGGASSELYTPLIYHWLKRRGLPQDEIADLVQNVLLVLVKKLPEFQPRAKGSFRSWLRTITVNQCRDYFRQQNSRQQRERTMAKLEAEESPADLFSQREYRRHLARRALQLMKNEFEDSTWRACWASVVEERSTAEIADQLNITPNAVYLAKSRVLQRLRQELDGLWD